jgi:hypothetical protein
MNTKTCPGLFALLSVWLTMAGASPAADAPSLRPDSAGPGRSSDAGQALPAGEKVIQRVLERSATLAARTNAPVWAYDKLQVMLKLDSDAKVEERTEKLYRVRIIQGVPFSRLIEVAGRELTEAELEQENEHEAAFQQGLSGRNPKKAVREHEALIITNIMDHFQFRVLSREAIQARQTLVLTFEAKPGKNDSSLQDRLLSRMVGTLWVDEETADVARLDVRLAKPFSLGVLGMLATIKECRMELLSKPMSDGTWLPEKTTLSLSARMLLSGMHMKMEETSSNFNLEPATDTTRPRPE